MGRRRRGTAAVRGGRRRPGRRPRPRGDRGHAPVGSAVGGARRRPPRRPLRPPRVRPRRRRRHPVLEPRRPRRGHGRRGPRPGGARGLLAGGLDRHRHRAGVPGARRRPRLDLRRASAGTTPRRRPVEAAAFERAEGSRRPRRTGRRCRPRRRACGWTASASRRGARLLRLARPCAGWPTRPTCRRSRTGTRSCSTRRPSGGSAEIRVPALVMIGGLDSPSTRVAPPTSSRRGIRGARRIDLPDVAHMPSLERPEWFTATLLEFLASRRPARARELAPPDHARDGDPDQRPFVEGVRARTAGTSLGAPRPRWRDRSRSDR